LGDVATFRDMAVLFDRHAWGLRPDGRGISHSIYFKLETKGIQEGPSVANSCRPKPNSPAAKAAPMSPLPPSSPTSVPSETAPTATWLSEDDKHRKCRLRRLLQRRDISFETVIPNAVASTSKLRMQISFLPFSRSEMKLRSIPTCSAMYT
jgi:hypothetical protein